MPMGVLNVSVVTVTSVPCRSRNVLRYECSRSPRAVASACDSGLAEVIVGSSGSISDVEASFRTWTRLLEFCGMEPIGILGTIVGVLRPELVACTTLSQVKLTSGFAKFIRAESRLARSSRSFFWAESFDDFASVGRMKFIDRGGPRGLLLGSSEPSIARP